MPRALATITVTAVLSGCGARSALDLTVIDAPRAVSPLSTATVTSRRPTFRWEPATGSVATRLEICRDRACATSLMTIDATGAQASPPTELPPGVAFWRLSARAHDGTRSAFGPTWQLQVGARSAPVDTSWGTSPDFDGDGRADVAVGAPTAFAHDGRAYVYLAGDAGLPSSPSITMSDAAGGRTQLGWRVASAGDVDGDGFADLLVSAPCASPSPGVPCGAGQVEVHLGGPLGPSAAAGATLPGPVDTPLSLGWSMAAAGDVNGDGYGDVIVAGHCAAPRCDHGVAYLYLGGPAGLAAQPAAALEPPDGAAISAVAGAGDTNGDGYGDVIIGTECFDPTAGPCGGGHAYVYLGGALGLGATPLVTLPGDGGSGHSGVSVAGAGDVDGDGYADVLVATSCSLGAGPCGPRHVQIYRGGPLGPSATAATDLALDAGVAAADGDGAGDVDGDGYADVVVGAINADFLTGAVRIHRGGPAGLDATPVAERTGTGTFGFPVAGAGDVDGDGYADVVVGAPETAAHAGQALLVHGGPGVVPPDSDTVLGAPDGGEFGFALAMAGAAPGHRARSRSAARVLMVMNRPGRGLGRVPPLDGTRARAAGRAGGVAGLFTGGSGGR